MTRHILAGDIGGTKTILCLMRPRAAAGPPQPLLPEILYEQRYASTAFPGLAPMVRAFLESAAAALGHAPEIGSACFGIAGPVVGGTAEVTNVGWSVSAGRLSSDLGIDCVRLINDFTAVGYGITSLGPADLVTLQEGAPDPQAPMALIGAGTGLGEGFLTPLPGGGYRAFPSEGSHADFAPRSREEFELADFIRERNGLTRISAERVISGMGIVSIYQFVRSREPERESPAMAGRYRMWEQKIQNSAQEVDLAAEISGAAMAGADYLCAKAMGIFVGAYGAEAGNLCLKLLPDGGLYIAGGIAPKILPLLQAGPFLSAFRDKGRLSGRMERFPVRVIVNERTGLLGAGLCAAEGNQAD